MGWEGSFISPIRKEFTASLHCVLVGGTNYLVTLILQLLDTVIENNFLLDFHTKVAWHEESVLSYAY